MKHAIALVDCDSFFVSCEQVLKPELIGQPVCVLSNNNGCVVSRSKEAKAVGVKMGMPFFMAKKEFPNVVYITGNLERYGEFSKKVMTKLKEYSPNVEVYSIDEAFIDLTGTERLYGKSLEEIIKMIRSDIFNELQIPVSIGLAPSKTLAKLASDKAKNTGGIFIITPEAINTILENTYLEEIWGIGKNMSIKLKRKGIFTPTELVKKEDQLLKSYFGVVGLNLKHELLGECISFVNPKEEAPQSIQHTSALKEFTNDKNVLKTALNTHIHSACKKLRRHGLLCSKVGTMLRTKDFRLLSLVKELDDSTNFELEIQKTVFELFEQIYLENTLYRSTGVYLLDFEAEAFKQLPLIYDEKDIKKSALAKCLDKIENKFGKNSIRTGY